MSNEILQDIINNFSPDKFVLFFRDKNRSFIPKQDAFSHYDDAKFTKGINLGEIKFQDGQKLIVCSFSASHELTERSGKKAQYEKAKNILRDLQAFSAGIFIFYDNNGNFRFSLIYPDAVGKSRQWSNFKRFTYFVSKELKNTTFIKRIGEKEFAGIEELKEMFSVEAVNKDFYNNIAYFFNELVGGEIQTGTKIKKFKSMLKLPIDYGKAKHKYQEFAVRLIGRIIFCWFLKHKKSKGGVPLIPDLLLSSKALRAPGDYYHSILEKIFFEALNTPVEKRKKDVKDLSQIPFLNGGLFEPHVDDCYDGRPLRSIIIPDSWFLGLFEKLEQFNFTIDENSSADVDVSVDPEMLGRIFENLLAEINPETGETARKATGSYYTPRPIVEYMVDQSLKQYLLNETGINEDKLMSLLSYNEQELALSESEQNKVINALDKIKVIDPACGSGAFPMGILHKMLLALQKIDPQSKKWFKKKLGKIDNDLVRKEAEEKLQDENWDYIHKLGIVQDSIFGIDIQPIAVEISKLRFFLSLVVDEKIDDHKYNRGIKPLPNLEFKFVAANSLIGLPKKHEDRKLKEVGLLFESDDDIKGLKKLRDAYLQSYGDEKKNIEEEFKQAQAKMFKKSIDWKVGDSQTLRLAEWDPFSSEAASWFDPEWMFGVKDGFDIVIANPPYGSEIDKQSIKIIRKEIKDTRNMNSAALFIDYGKNKFLSKDGILTFIVPKSLLYSERWFALVESMLGKVSVLIDVEKAFEKVLLEQVVFVYSEFMGSNSFMAKKFKDDTFIQTTYINNDLVMRLQAWICDVSNKEIDILNKILSGHVIFMRDISDTKRGVGLQKHLSKKGDYPIIGGANIFRYGIDGIKGHLPESVIKNKTKKIGFMKQKKIVSQDVIAHIQNPFPHIKLMSCLDSEGRIFGLDTVQNTILINEEYDYRYILAVLNSSFTSWYTYKFIYCSAIRTMHFDRHYIGKIPIPDRPTDIQKPFISLVDRIHALTKDSDYLKNPEKQTKVQKYEKEIDQMIYKLYGLTEAEIKVVEGNNGSQ